MAWQFVLTAVRNGGSKRALFWVVEEGFCDEQVEKKRGRPYWNNPRRKRMEVRGN